MRCMGRGCTLLLPSSSPSLSIVLFWLRSLCRSGAASALMRNKVIKKIKYQEINPEDIFLDSANLPGFDEHRFEGRIEKPMGQEAFLVLKIVLALVMLALVSKLWLLWLGI